MSFNKLFLATAVGLLVTNSHAAEQAAGLTLDSSGVGITYSRVVDFGWNEDDQYQLRASLTGLNESDIDDAEINDIDYEADVDSFGARLGMDWYPFEGKYSSAMFFSGGLTYFDYEIEARSESNQSYSVGSTAVTPADGVTLQTDIEQSSAAPYVSMGWGNRLSEDRNWYFQAELGLLAPFSDADVSVSATDPNTVLSAADLARERKEIEDEINGLSAFGSVSVTYMF